MLSAMGTAPMRDLESEIVYFRRLAVRCRRASQECFETSAREEFRALAEEFTAKADALAQAYYQTASR